MSSTTARWHARNCSHGSYFISTEIHKGFSPLFNSATPAEYQPLVIDRLLSHLKWVDSQLAGRHYLMGEAFSVASPTSLP